MSAPLEKPLLEELEAVHAKKFSVSPRTALLSLPILRFDNDETVVPFLKCGRLPMGITIEPVCRPIEHYSSASDRPVRDWFGTWKRDLTEMLLAN